MSSKHLPKTLKLDWQDKVKVLNQGQELLWNTKFEQAQQLVEGRWKDDAFFALFYAEVQTWQALLSTPTPKGNAVRAEALRRLKYAKDLSSALRKFCNPARNCKVC